MPASSLTSNPDRDGATRSSRSGNRDAGPRWARRKEDRPSELLAAALDLFVERGFAATRLDDIAQRAGVSKGTLYLYYASKEDLFKALVRATVVPLIEQLAREVAHSNIASGDLVRQFFTQWWAKVGTTKLAGICKLIIGESGNFPDVARFFHQEVIEPNTRVLATIFERGIQRGEFRPIDIEVSVHLWMAPLVLKAIWDCSIAPACVPDGGVSPERYVELHIAHVLDALRVQP